MADYIEKGYVAGETELGKLFYKADEVELSEDEEAWVLYERKPWLEAFRLEGIRPKKLVRKGPGSKLARDFVPDLLEIYDDALVLYHKYCESGTFDALGYYKEVDSYFKSLADTAGGRDEDGSAGIGQGQKRAEELSKMYRGFLANMWFDGDAKVEAIIREIAPYVIK